MERRKFLKLFSIGSTSALGGYLVWRNQNRLIPMALRHPESVAELGHGTLSSVSQVEIESALDSTISPELVSGLEAGLEAGLDAGLEDMVTTHPEELIESIRYMSSPAPDMVRWLKAFRSPVIEDVKLVERPRAVENYLSKMEHFENSHLDDVFLESEKYKLLVRVFKRIDRVQNLVGHGNFNVISFDEMLKIGRQHRSVGAFTRPELDYIEALFATNVRQYGFFGDKVITELTSGIAQKDRIKMKHTGHFLFRGRSEALYKKLRHDLGPNVVLTSGIRSVVKQTHLFLAKTIQSKGNLSRASRSLAPPGHSFHGIGDFDVGKVGFGPKNFTEDFAKTDEFKRLVDLGYVAMRYPKNNLLGVRYEPWHIKVV